MKQNITIFYLLICLFSLFHSGETYSSSADRCRRDFSNAINFIQKYRAALKEVPKDKPSRKLYDQTVLEFRGIGGAEGLKKILLQFLENNPEWITDLEQKQVNNSYKTGRNVMEDFFMQIIVPILQVDTLNELIEKVRNITGDQYKTVDEEIMKMDRLKQYIIVRRLAMYNRLPNN